MMRVALYACLTGVMFMFMFFEKQPNTRKAALQLGMNISLGRCFCIFAKCAILSN